MERSHRRLGGWKSSDLDPFCSRSCASLFNLQHRNKLTRTKLKPNLKQASILATSLNQARNPPKCVPPSSPARVCRVCRVPHRQDLRIQCGAQRHGQTSNPRAGAAPKSSVDERVRLGVRWRWKSERSRLDEKHEEVE